MVPTTSKTTSPWRLFMWALTALASILPAWLAFYWLTGLRPPISDRALMATVVVVPFAAMFSLTIWAFVHIARSPLSSAQQTTWVLLVFFTGYFAASIYFYRHLGVSAPATPGNADRAGNPQAAA